MPPAADTAVHPDLRVFVVLNPKSGSCSAEEIRRLLGDHFACEDGACRVLEIGGPDDLGAAVREAVGRGIDLVVAAGGDGTVSAVANALGAGREPPPVPIGIIPLGTANVLARELGIPIDPEDACRLLAGEHTTKGLDAIRLGGKIYFTQVGVGIDALMIRDTKAEHKRRFGRAAYLWTAFSRLLGFQPRRFLLEVDGKARKVRASQVVVANGGILGQPPFRWGPDIRPDDGRLDVCIVRARTLPAYLGIAWDVAWHRHDRNRNVRYLPAERSISIRTRRPLPVQADGEIVGETPVRVEVVPGAVRVVVPVAIAATT